MYTHSLRASNIYVYVYVYLAHSQRRFVSYQKWSIAFRDRKEFLRQELPKHILIGQGYDAYVPDRRARLSILNRE